MAIVWNFGLESGTLLTTDTPPGEFGAHVGADITVTTDAKMAGTRYGISVPVDTAAEYVAPPTLGAPDASGIARFRFYFDPNSLSMNPGDEFKLFLLRYLTGPVSVAQIGLIRDAGYYKIYGSGYDDGNNNIDTANYIIADAPHYIEAQVTKSSGANDGTFTLWIDGVQKEVISNLDNDVRMANYNSFRWGVPISNPVGTTGTFYLDQFTLNDDGGEIGPFINPINGCLLYGYNTPASLESAVPWPTWDDGAAGAVTVTGDANWGKLQLIAGAEGRSKVIDFGDSNPRTYTIAENTYGTGQGDADLEIRGDTNPFTQDDALPAWNAYTVPTLQSWRYVQIRESRE